MIRLLFCLLCLTSTARALEPIPEIPRRLPPPAEIELSAQVRESLEARVADYEEKLWEIDHRDQAADVGVLVKAVDFALRHGEFYAEKDIAVASGMLDLADTRYRELYEERATPWIEARGLVARGYRSTIDESYQPFGLQIPEDLDLTNPVPLLVWLHGRGETLTDLHFLQKCRTSSQAFKGGVAEQDDCIILYPFGRQCVGFKSAGEIDVLEAIAKVKRDYNIDPDKVALAGFSMGGGGAWHIGAHYRDQFCAVHAGAGFSESKEFLRLTPEQYPASYTQTLWQVYDAPDYLRNFLNGPLLAYSGEVDKQKQAADVMEQELATIDYELRHIVGSGMGHDYDEDSVETIWAWLEEIWSKAPVERLEQVIWQTPTLRYPGHSWLQLTGLEEHWKTAIASAAFVDDSSLALDLENVSSLRVGGDGISFAGVEVQVDGAVLKAEDPGFPLNVLSLVKAEGKWKWGEPDKGAKRPGIQGPIDDAFLSRFIVVPPSQKPNSERLARWVDFEMDHFQSRWSEVMRGEALVKSADDLDSDDIATANLILWGDPDSNPMIAEIADQLPVKWTEDGFTFRGESYRAAESAPALIFPNPLNPDRYIVINSGLTFREGTDYNNAQQNPILPDWVIFDLNHLPDKDTAGRVVDAGFFDERWK